MNAFRTIHHQAPYLMHLLRMSAFQTPIYFTSRPHSLHQQHIPKTTPSHRGLCGRLPAVALSSRQSTERRKQRTLLASKTRTSKSSQSQRRSASPDKHKNNDDEKSDHTLLSYVKQKGAEGGVRKMVDAVHAAEQGIQTENQWDFPDATVYRTAIRFLLRASRLDLALQLHSLRVDAFAKRPRQLSSDFRLTAAVLRAVLISAPKRSQRSEYSATLFGVLRENCLILCDENNNSSHPLFLGKNDAQNDVQADQKAIIHSDFNEQVSANDVSSSDDQTEPETTEYDFSATVKDMAVALSNVVKASVPDRRGRGTPEENIREYDTERADEAIKLLKKLSKTHGRKAALEVSSYNDLIRALGKARRIMRVFDVLDLMDYAGVPKDGTTFEFMANAAVRQVEFVTGAVSMDTLPPPLGAEIAFIGRSNVGKSSLVNMLVNRKALAYVSGRPGKTQQFNYFVVNQRDPSSAFHLVDLPGVGYAKVPRPLQQEWMRFMMQYFKQRISLQVVFHLVDGRHGALADDEVLMAEMGKLRGSFHYVVVLTKMDKVDKKRVARDILNTTRSALVRNGCGEDVPIVATSAESKLGRDEMWLHLQTALRALYTSTT